MPTIFDGLEKFGLSNFEKFELYVKEEPNIKISITKKKEFNIDDYVYQKTFECPVCDKTFKNYVIKIKKMQPVFIDYDLRPVFKELIQPMFYDIISCSHCGYSSISQKFNSISTNQAEKILNTISKSFINYDYPAILTLDLAIERYKLALLNAVIKQAKDSEKAYICMKLSWLYRFKEDEQLELEFIDKSYYGFISAYQNESLPVCGLDEHILIYILSAFAMRLKIYDNAQKLISKLILSRNTPKRLKDRALDLKEQIIKNKEKEKEKNKIAK